MSSTTDDTPRVRVLVVDDSRLMHAAFNKILGGEFDLVTARDGEAGWERLTEEEGIQAVISDADMPRLDGYGLIHRIRAATDPRIRDLPVIMVTGAEDAATRTRALDVGATDFITKPLDPTQLLARVRTHARLDRTRRALAATTEALEDQGAVDPVTGLGSRRYFVQRGTQDLSFARRHDRPVSLVAFALDNYEDVQDQHGAEVAQDLLNWAARILRGRVRTEDTVARLTGAQFVILAPSTNRLQAVVLCKRLQAGLVNDPFQGPTGQLAVTISLVQVSVGRDDATNFPELLRRVLEQLLAIRAAGGNRLDLGRAAHRPADPVGAPTPGGVPAPVAGGHPEPEPAPDLAAAAHLLHEGQGRRLDPHLPRLLRLLLPLLEYGNERLRLGVDDALETLRRRIIHAAPEATPGSTGPVAHRPEPCADLRRGGPAEHTDHHDGED
ncbi:MAG: hypothetical protein B7Z66_06170 [Chromatiales bacterium 21-64-14]|nr:MAG: hypothetical protein B7Z66_06170 [Chromatiales bacterium 21-64-14]HQU15901.1 response regulator [Gammaproteobacteria bacterium]